MAAEAKIQNYLAYYIACKCVAQTVRSGAFYLFEIVFNFSFKYARSVSDDCIIFTLTTHHSMETSWCAMFFKKSIRSVSTVGQIHYFTCFFTFLKNVEKIPKKYNSSLFLNFSKITSQNIQNIVVRKMISDKLRSRKFWVMLVTRTFCFCSEGPLRLCQSFLLWIKGSQSNFQRIWVFGEFLISHILKWKRISWSNSEWCIRTSIVNRKWCNRSSDIMLPSIIDRRTFFCIRSSIIWKLERKSFDHKTLRPIRSSIVGHRSSDVDH